MTAPIATDPIVARGRSRLGLRLSPASWMACSKPSSAKMMPLVLIALSTPLAPNGAKPCEVKLCGWKLVAAMTKIAPRGTAIFHHVAALLVCASTFTPRKFTATKTAIRRTATTRPLAVSVPFAFRNPWAHFQ